MSSLLFILNMNAQAEPIAYGQLNLTGWRTQTSGDFTFGNRVQLGKNNPTEFTATTGVSLTPNQADSQAKLTVTLPIGFLFGGEASFARHFGFGTSLVDYDRSDAGYGTNLGLLTYVENTNRRSSGEEWSLGLTSGLERRFGKMSTRWVVQWSYKHISAPKALGNWVFSPRDELMLKLNGDHVVESQLGLRFSTPWTLPWFQQPGTPLLIGWATSYAWGAFANDHILRSGISLSALLGPDWGHELRIQPAIIDRAYAQLPPYTHYQLWMRFK